MKSDLYTLYDVHFYNVDVCFLSLHLIQWNTEIHVESSVFPFLDNVYIYRGRTLWV